MLITIRLGRTMYRIKPENEARIMEGYAKAAKIKHKPARPKAPKRTYPRFGDSLSTHAYVRDFYAMNGLGETNHFAPLTMHVSIPQGVDSMEVEA
jgi:hypothetical protein